MSPPRSTGTHVIDKRTAATLRTAMQRRGAVPAKNADGTEGPVPLPNCRKCGKPLKEGGKYFSKNSHTRHYYHVACWNRIALAHEPDEEPDPE